VKAIPKEAGNACFGRNTSSEEDCLIKTDSLCISSHEIAEVWFLQIRFSPEPWLFACQFSHAGQGITDHPNSKKALRNTRNTL
jgi:hypothetical protein